jgi:predicted transcriptional regulator YdeE
MNPKVIDEAGFSVIGIAVRTSNTREMTSQGMIPSQWNRFMSENLLAAIPARTDSAIIAVYTDYVGDADCTYTFLIGARVEPGVTAPSNMVRKDVPAGRYVIFPSERGPVERVVVEAWQRVWSSDVKRALKADYEVYDERAADLRNAQVDLHVGVE